MLNKKKEELETEKGVYEFGLVKLQETEAKVGELQEDLKIIQVDVEKKKSEADQVAEIVGREKSKVEEENKKAMIEEENCMLIKKEVEEQKTSCEADVKKLVPIVENAKEKLSGLNVKEI